MPRPRFAFRRLLFVGLAALSAVFPAALAVAAPPAAARGARGDAGETDASLESERPSLSGRFGLERLVFGFLCQKGLDPSKWPAEVRGFIDGAA